jgi:ATP-dependent DNA helicase RecQ
VPPYIIFHDSTLVAMAAARPGSLAEMAQIPGVGASKLSRYGEQFLDTIASSRR